MSKSKDPPPAEPIPQSTVIALQAWKDKNKISNANWESKLNEAVTVNPGDSIFVKASFIDTRGTASGNIDLAVDTEISLEYYFYWIHTFNACDASGLIQAPVTPDASNNLNQQVLVGGPINYIMGDVVPNIPAYYTSNTNGDPYAATGINDADGLPYLVMQSINNVPVPGIIGTEQDALYIVVGNIYLVAIVGLTTNWAYAGVPNANYNELPAGWDLNTDYFTAANNPQLDLPTSAFIPAASATPLPYITYIITTVGNTDWIGIDPGLASNQISALDMVNGGRYVIVTTNPTWDFTYWGASSNTVGTVFTATIPPALPMAFPATITTATFLANAATWFFPNGGPIFGADPLDTFDVVIDIDLATNLMVFNSVSGSGPWLAPTETGIVAGAWGIPNSYFGFSMIGTPLANVAQATTNITNITATITGLSVTNLIPGKTYKVLDTGELDGSVPQFTWNMVGTFPGYNSTTMSDGTFYQIIAPYEGVTFPAIPGLGQVSVIFNQQGGEIQPPPGPQQLIKFSGGQQVFVATGSYTGTGTLATVEQYTLATCTIDGSGYTPPMVEASVIEPGTVVHAINPDPGLPTDNGGRANVSALQAGSTTPYEYDGHVYNYTPPTTRVDIRPVKKRWSMTIPKGSYNPNYLAELISRNMSKQKIKRVNNVLGTPLGGPQSTLTVPTDSIYSNVPAGNVWANPVGPGANTFYDSKNPKVYDYPPALDYNLLPDNTDDMPFLFCPAMNSSVLNNDPTDASMNYIYAEIPHPNANGLNNLPNPTYYVNLVPLCNDVFSVSPTLNTIQVQNFGGLYSILPFYTQNSLTTDGANATGNSGVFPIVFGANQTSLLYNNENNGLFSFNYLHSPIYAALSSASTALAECTAHMYTTQKSSTNMVGTNFFTTLVDKKSGILLNKMEPASFWNQLGFDIPALTVDLDQDPNGYGFYMSFKEFQAKTTGGFCGSSNIFNPLFKTANSADQPCVPDTELIYLTAVPAAVDPADIIPAFSTTPLTINQSYKIYYQGEVFLDQLKVPLFNWSSIGGPNNGTNPTGVIFTATSTGFDPNNPPEGQGWQSPPLVVAPDTSVTTVTQLQNTYFQVENTNTLNAGTIPTVRDSTGHYLVEITGYNSNYIDGDSKYEIKALVSAYWVSPGSFVSVPFADSYNFFGTGSPITLSSLKVRILDPFTMQDAVIGSNSSIYLQVNKMLTEQAVAQIPN